MLFLVDAEESSLLLSLIRTLLLDICNIIYKLIITFYELFLAVGDATILNNEQLQPIFSRVGLILGIIMLFRLIFSFVQYMIDPDKITDKESGMGNLIKKVLVVVIALGLSNWVFTKAFEIQHIILEENTIGKVVLGMPSNDKLEMTDYGILFSYQVFSIFYHQSEGLTAEGLADAEEINCGPSFYDINGGTLINFIATYKDFDAAHMCVNEAGSADGGNFSWGNKVYYTQFDGLTAIVVGIFILWMLIMYTITLGVRVVKLAFLRIIAPVPILSYLSPKKDTAFQRWIKQCVTTYLDLFIRLAIIFFALYLISIIFNSTSGGLNAATWLPAYSDLWKWFQLILVLGILLFAKKVPDLISELFPGMGGKSGLGFDLGLKSRTDFLGSGLVKRAVGAAVGGAAIGLLGASQGVFRTINKQRWGKVKNANGEYEDGWVNKSAKEMRKERARNIFGGLGMGAARGMFQGAHGGKIGANLDKAFHNQVTSSNNDEAFVVAGGERFGSVWSNRIARHFGFPTAFEKMSQELNNDRNTQKNVEASRDSASKTADSFETTTNRFKQKVQDNDSAKTTIDVGTMEDGAVAHLVSKGKVVNVNGEYRIVKGLRHDENSNVVPVYGSAIQGMQFHAVDDEITRYAADTDTEITRLNNERGMLEDKHQKYVALTQRIASADSVINPILSKPGMTSEERVILDTQQAIKEKAVAELEKLDFDPGTYETYMQTLDARLEEQSFIRGSVNLPNIHKTIAESMDIELMRGQYDDATAVHDFETAKEALKTTIQGMTTTSTSLSGSTEQVYKNAGVEIGKAARIFGNMLDKISQVGQDTTLDTLFSESEFQGLAEDSPNRWYKRDGDTVKIEIPDFDGVESNGTHVTKTMEIHDLFELKDELTNAVRSYYRGNDVLSHRIAADITAKENDPAYQQAKIYSESFKDRH